jgi:hypothetical protein
MRADTHDGPEQIAPLQRPDTLMQLSRSLILEVHLVPHGRAIHCGTKRQFVALRQLGRYWVQSGHFMSAGAAEGSRGRASTLPFAVAHRSGLWVISWVKE